MLPLVVATERSKRDGPLILACDVSGGSTDGVRWAHEALEVLPEVTRLLWFDHEVYPQMVFGDRRPRPWQGGGGTNFDKVVSFYRGAPLRALVVVTDGEGIVSAREPGYPVIWVIRGANPKQFVAPFGEVVIWE